MKPTTALYGALGFLIVLALIAVFVWFYVQFSNGSNSAEDGGGGIFSALFPFGESLGSLGGIFDDGPDEELTGPVPLLRKVSDKQVAGAEFVVGLHGGLAVRYVERDTGHLYETPVDALTSVRLTNTTVPGIHDAQWINASTTLMRFLGDDDTIENFVGTFTGTSTDQELQGGFLNRYNRVAIGPDSTVLGLTVSPSGGILEVADAETLTARQLLVTPLSSWIPHGAGGRWFVSSAPSGGTNGGLYELTAGTMRPLLKDVPGLQVLFHPNANEVLYSSGAQNALSLSVINFATGEKLTFDRATLVSKCAWVKDGQALCGVPKSLDQAFYPDEWLLGRVHTSDELWYFTSEYGRMTTVMDLQLQAGIALDVSQLAVSSDGKYALFIDRITGTLWVATLGAE